MSELDALLREFDEAADHIHQLVSDLRNMFSGPEEPAEPEKEISLEELRGLCGRKSKAGFRDQVRELIRSTGAPRVSVLEPSRYKELYDKVEALR